MPPDEYQTLMQVMTEGFAGVHNRLDTFKDEYSAHRIICTGLFAELNKDEARRIGKENGIASELRKQIDWSKVKTGATIAVFGLLAVAAIKILFANLGNWVW